MGWDGGGKRLWCGRRAYSACHAALSETRTAACASVGGVCKSSALPVADAVVGNADGSAATEGRSAVSTRASAFCSRGGSRGSVRMQEADRAGPKRARAGLRASSWPRGLRGSARERRRTGEAEAFARRWLPCTLCAPRAAGSCTGERARVGWSQPRAHLRERAGRRACRTKHTCPRAFNRGIRWTKGVTVTIHRWQAWPAPSSRRYPKKCQESGHCDGTQA
jgi:hypothetical protein